MGILNRGQIIQNIQVNLDDAGVSFFQPADYDDSLQDAYDDVCVNTQCNVRIADNQAWVANKVYYNPSVDLGLSDYIAVVAIFNYNTNRWLRDDLTLRDFDRIQRNWEIWQGTPQFWAPSDPLHFAIAPNYGNIPTGTFKLVYWGQAPQLTSDSQTFLTAGDMDSIYEFYCTADLLEQAQEYNKAGEWWNKYYDKLSEYSDRVKRNNKSDLLLRV